MIDSGYPVGLVRDALEDLAAASGRPTVQAIVFPTSILVSSAESAVAQTRAVSAGDSSYLLHQVDMVDRIVGVARSRPGAAAWVRRQIDHVAGLPCAVLAPAADRRLRPPVGRAQCASRVLLAGGSARRASGTRGRNGAAPHRAPRVEFPSARRRRSLAERRADRAPRRPRGRSGRSPRDGRTAGHTPARRTADHRRHRARDRPDHVGSGARRPPVRCACSFWRPASSRHPHSSAFPHSIPAEPTRSVRSPRGSRWRCSVSASPSISARGRDRSDGSWSCSTWPTERRCSETSSSTECCRHSWAPPR